MKTGSTPLLTSCAANPIPHGELPEFAEGRTTHHSTLFHLPRDLRQSLDQRLRLVAEA